MIVFLLNVFNIYNRYSFILLKHRFKSDGNEIWIFIK